MSGAVLRAVRRGTLLGRAVEPRGAGVGLAVLVIVALIAVLADVIAPYSPNQIQPAGILASPTLEHPLGTDAIGRDVLSRMIFGSRVSLSAGVVSVARSASTES